MNGNTGISITLWILFGVLVLIIIFQDKVKQFFVDKAKDNADPNDIQNIRINRVVTLVRNGHTEYDANTRVSGRVNNINSIKRGDAGSTKSPTKPLKGTGFPR